VRVCDGAEVDDAVGAPVVAWCVEDVLGSAHDGNALGYCSRARDTDRGNKVENERITSLRRRVV